MFLRVVLIIHFFQKLIIRTTLTINADHSEQENQPKAKLCAHFYLQNLLPTHPI